MRNIYDLLVAEKNNYDRIAGNYDLISRLVFQKAIVRSQQSLLSFIHAPANILIVGGGTGWILEEIAKIHPGGLLITYLDMSPKMISLARKRSWQQNDVAFLPIPVEDFTTNHHFDIILTPFLFDNFTATQARSNFDLLNKLLEPDGIWLFVDFKIRKGLSSIWQKPLLKCMYWFFGMVSGVKTKVLPDMETIFNEENYEIVFESRHFFGFIQSCAFRRSSRHS